MDQGTSRDDSESGFSLHQAGKDADSLEFIVSPDGKDIH
jgi:hypothetical protein